MFIGTIASSNPIYVQITVPLGFFTIIIFAIFRGDELKRYEITELPLSKITELQAQEGLVKVKGTLSCDSSIKSKLTSVDCIGYSYTAMKQHYKKRFDKSESQAFKVFDSKTECLDFYIYDGVGRVKVQSKDIIILSDLNSHKIKKGHIIHAENVLLSNQQKYYLIGEIVKVGKKIVIAKSDEKGLIIASPNEYDIFLNSSKAYRIGCAVFLIILLVCFFLILLF